MCYTKRHHETPHITGHYETLSDNVEHSEVGVWLGWALLKPEQTLLGHCVNLHVYNNTYHVHTPGYSTCIYMYCRNIHSGRPTCKLLVFCTLLSAFSMIHRSRRVLGKGWVTLKLRVGIVHTLTSGGVVHVKVDLHLDSVHGRGGHIQ